MAFAQSETLNVFTFRIVSELQDEVESLIALRATTSKGNLIIAEPKLYMTQIDGKVLSTIMGTSSQQCAICGAAPSQFNVEANIGTDIFRPFEDALNYGISPLHCWLNSFNHLFKLSVRLPIEQGRVEGAENKQICKQRKIELQTSLKQELGIRAFFRIQLERETVIMETALVEHFGTLKNLREYSDWTRKWLRTSKRC